MDDLDEYAEINGVAIWDEDAEVEDVDDYAKMSDLLKQYKLGDADDFFEREIDGDTYYIIVGNEDVKVVEEDDDDENGVVLTGDSSVIIAASIYAQGWNDGIQEYDDVFEDAGIGGSSAKLSVMESDAATVNMLLKEAVNNMLANQKSVKYNGVSATSSDLTVKDVLIANDMKYDDGFFKRKIGKDTYMLVIESATSGGFKITAATTGTELTADTKIITLALIAYGS